METKKKKSKKPVPPKEPSPAPRMATEKQMALMHVLLKNTGRSLVNPNLRMTFEEVTENIDYLIHLPTLRQRAVLVQKGFDDSMVDEMTKSEAAQLIGEIMHQTEPPSPPTVADVAFTELAQSGPKPFEELN